jgi:hypothetical protein
MLEGYIADLYSKLKKKSGRNCFTLTHNKPAKMYVNDGGVTINYPSGRSLELPRSMVTEAIHILENRGILTLDEVHERIIERKGDQTDRLLAVLREIPGVTYTARPRALYFRKKIQ